MIPDTFAQSWFEWMAAMSWQFAALVFVVLGLERLFGVRLWPGVRFALWGVVGLRLVVPPMFESTWSWAQWWPLPVIRALPGSIDPLGGASSWRLPLGFESASPWLAASLGLWVVVAGALLWTRTFSLLRLRAQLTHDESEPQVQTRELFERTAATLGVRGRVSLLVTRSASVPLILGVLRPVVVLPWKLERRLSERALQHILLHELLHLRRGDLWAQWTWDVLAFAYWFHPLVWTARRRAYEARELACDHAARSFVVDVREYRRTLCEVAKQVHFDESLQGVVALFRRRATIAARLRQLDVRSPHRVTERCAALIASIVAILCVLPMGTARSELSAAEAKVEALSTPEASCFELRFALLRAEQMRRALNSGASPESPPNDE